MNSNKHLYFYGLFANVKQFFGRALIVFGIFFSFFVALASKSLIAGGIVFIVIAAFGVYIVLSGKAQRFDYQRQSGSIIHQGDGGNW